ncbi:MAG: SNF2-related protein [Sphingopyxis sp.]|uniref:SNF2-related protein n=1 Tax=Sphingopyxis sp. TaxID=1908224 RepID=UPI003D6D00C4
MSDPFIDLCLGVQAVRRSVEREILGLGGALGVAAAPYPHQLANVQRILTDTRIRHLIADEVGLGKTVQALMVLNALKLRNPNHRALILVPENLAPQWMLECSARGHIVPGSDPPLEERGPHVRLAYYEQLGSVTEIDPSIYDLLIVDEIQRLQSDMRQRIENVAGDFRQLLLLSATPKLEERDALRQLFHILEPDRMALAAVESDEPEAILLAREKRAAELLDGGKSEEWIAAGMAPPPERERSRSVAATYCCVRRVTNARRRDYPDLLPQRELKRVAVEPTDDEVARQREVWRYINFARTNDGPTDLARLGQVALRSPRALAERINVLGRRDQRDPHGYLQQATQHLGAQNGDSRLEALIDVLAGIWRANPREGVLVVAEDNPTVDYLERVIPQYLPEIGPRGNRRRISVAVKRNRDASATANFVDLFEEYEESLGGFVDGDDQLLVAADVAQVGLNLQHARKLIFFSMPWSPMAVEQWIGRLDRLGSAALSDDSRDPTIDIYVIYQTGQVDERVVNVLDEFAVFRRSIRLDSDEMKRVTEHIEVAALAPRTGDWAGLSVEARQCSGDEDDPLATPLSAFLPWTAERARSLAARYDKVGCLGPMIERTQAKRAIVRVEAGLRGWMRLIQRSDGLRLWKKRESSEQEGSFRLLHYFRPPYSTGPIEPRFLLPGLDPQAGERYAYLDQRRDLETPPVAIVDIDNDPATPLHFLDHGNAVHDTLLEAWQEIGNASPRRLKISFPPGHPLAVPEAAGVYQLLVMQWVPGDLHIAEFDPQPVYARLAEARTDTERKIFWDAALGMEEEHRADRRWLNSLFTSRLDVIAARYSDGEWSLVDQSVADALLTPWNIEARGQDVKLASGGAAAIPPDAKASAQKGSDILIAEYYARHQKTLAECSNFAAKIAERRYQFEAEANEALGYRQAILDDAAAQGMETSEQGFTRSRFRTFRHARDMAALGRDIRLARLNSLGTELHELRLKDYKHAILII